MYKYKPAHRADAAEWGLVHQCFDQKKNIFVVTTVWPFHRCLALRDSFLDPAIPLSFVVV